MSKKKLLFVCFDNYTDLSNGASISTRELLLGLSESGWSVHTLCSDKLDVNAFASDAESKTNIFAAMANRGMQFISRAKNRSGERFSIENFRDGGIFSTLFLPENNAYPPSKPVGSIFLRLFQETLRSYKPDIVLTYGGDYLGISMLRLCQMEGFPVAATIHNFAYEDTVYCKTANLIIVPSQFTADFYQQKHGVKCVPLPPVMDKETLTWSNEPEQRKYLTFINPGLNKGILWFTGIVHSLTQLRPDIPILMVQGRSRWDWIAETAVVFDKHPNLFGIGNTPYPQDFYAETKAVIMPSLWRESFGRTAAEPMLNGIPIIASNRGALPETVGDAGILLDIPEEYTPRSNMVPADKTVKPWVDAIIKVWDDKEYYDELSKRALEHSKRWHYDNVIKQYETVLNDAVANKSISRKQADESHDSYTYALVYSAQTLDEKVLKTLSEFHAADKSETAAENGSPAVRPRIVNNKVNRPQICKIKFVD
jgi:glycosyltransferase involved in cell wall biosynthesis